MTKEGSWLRWFPNRVANNQAIASSGMQSSKPIRPQPYIYFNIGIFHEDNQCQTLQCGRSYQVVISTAYESYPGWCSEPLSSPIESILKLELCSELSIEDHICLFPSKSMIPFKHSFKVYIPEKYPICDITFMLIGHMKNIKCPKTIIRISARIEGIYSSDDKQWLLSRNVNIFPLLPKCTAILYVTVSHSDQVDLEGWHNGKSIKVRWVGWDDREPISLAECIKKQELPHDIIMRLRNFSRRGPRELHKWLRNLIDDFGAELCAIIVDITTFETPWEMFEVDDDEIYLGAKARVVRWTAIQNYSRTLLLQVQDIHYQGSVLAYVNDKALGSGQTSAEREALKVVPHTNIQEFKRHLLTTDSFKNVGLIYLADHGYDGTNIGLGFSSSERITSNDLEELRMQQEDARPLIFANLCESACLMRSNNGFFNGLLEVLLARCASGYIGTLAKVGSSHASDIAQRLLQAAYTNQKGVQIAEFLRELRDDAVKRKNGSSVQHLNETDRERKLYFLYTFTYVYYGNPLSKLRLIAEKEEKKEI